MKQRIGTDRWSSRSLTLGRRGADPRARRDAQRGVAPGLRLDAPVTQNRRGQIALALEPDGPLKVVKQRLRLVPATRVGSLKQASTIQEVVDHLNTVLDALKGAGLMEN